MPMAPTLIDDDDRRESFRRSAAWTLPLVCCGFIWSGAKSLTWTAVFLASMFSLGCSATIWAAAELLTRTDFFLAWMPLLVCYGTAWSAAELITRTTFILGLFGVWVLRFCDFIGSPFSQSVGGARERRRMVVLEIDRLIARQNQTCLRKLQALRDSYLGSMNVLNEKIVRLLSFNCPRSTKMRTKSSRSSGCSTLRGDGFLSCFRVVEASSAFTPRPLTSRKPLTSQIFSYMSDSATIVAMILTFTTVGLSIYFHRSERGHGVPGALDVLLRPFRERRDGVHMSLQFLEVRDLNLMRVTKLKGLKYDSRPSPARASVSLPPRV